MNALLILLLAYLGFSTLYILIFGLSGLLRTRDSQKLTQLENKSIAVLIPAYKEDLIIEETAKRALQQNYPANKFEIVVIADSLKPVTINRLSTLPITIIEVKFEKSTKAKALNMAMAMLPDRDITVVLDADNVMEPDFLAKVNKAYQKGHWAMQGHRVAKNMETPMAILDAISEEINNRIFRKGHQNLGLSSALIGSGMAFDYTLFKEKMSHIDALGGFDKALELALLKEKINIHYLEDAFVFDEKVSSDQVFTNQRTRWIAAQIRYGIHSFGDALKELILRRNVDYFDKSLQFLLPPRLIGLGGVFALALITLFFSFGLFPIAIGLLGVYIAALALSTPASFWTMDTLKASFTLPKTFFLMIKALLGFKKASKSFLHTPHTTLS